MSNIAELKEVSSTCYDRFGGPFTSCNQTPAYFYAFTITRETGPTKLMWSRVCNKLQPKLFRVRTSQSGSSVCLVGCIKS